MASKSFVVYACKLLCVVIFLAMIKDLLFSNSTTSNFDYDKKIDFIRKGDYTNYSNYNLIINTYMRSGSTFLGKIFSIRTDTFYVFEPLWNGQTFAFYWGPRDVCHYSANKCAKQGSDAVRKGVGSSVTWEASKDFLQSILDCTFKDHMAFLPDPRHFPHEFPNQKHSWVFGKGSLWDPYIQCAGNPQSTYNQCFSLMYPVCQYARHKVMKVLRSTLDNLEAMLKSNENLKVIQLFRDPRGIVNSHLHTGFYQTKVQTTSQLKNDIKTLCARMEYDIKSAVRLRRLFPDRFKIVQYETFGDLFSSARALYNFMELEITREIEHSLGKLIRAENSTKGFHPYNYRTSLPWYTERIANKYCTNVFNSLGYPIFRNEISYRNLDEVPNGLPYTLY